MNDFPQFDDVGSFPLPVNINREDFERFYWIAYKAIINKSDIFENKGISIHCIDPILNSLQLKMNSGIEIANYPQHIDMYTQFLKPITDYETNPNLIDSFKKIMLTIWLHGC